jgi:hypothetical protein
VIAYCDDGLIGTSDCGGSVPTDPVYEYQYDGLGRAYEINNHYLEVSANPLIMRYGFDRFGHRKFLDVSRDGSTLISYDYAYNEMDQVEAITDNNYMRDNIILLSFRNSGRMERIDHMNGSHANFGYDSCNIISI